MSNSAVPELDSRVSRKSYIITYSQADIKKFPTRQSFADVVLEAFSQGNSKVVLQYWVCCLERHQESSGVHYHMAVVFSRNKRWLSAKQFLLKNYGISVHFADKKHHDFYSAYRYVTKEDSSALLCPDHPPFALGLSPHTSKSSRARVEKLSRKRSSASEAASSDQQPSKPSKARRLSNLDVANLVVSEGIYNDVSFLAHGKEQNELGKSDLANFLLSRSAKSRNELINSAWKMQNAPETIACSKFSRMDIVQEALSGSCVDGCDGAWLTCAKELLRNNHVNAYLFAGAMRELLEKGRGKHHNIMIVGPANCGKTFILNPLNDLFETFTNPANTVPAMPGLVLKWPMSYF